MTEKIKPVIRQKKSVIRRKNGPIRSRELYDIYLRRKTQRGLYPKDWKKEIVPRILARDGYRCRECGVERYAVGEWDGGVFIRWRQAASFKDGQRIAAILSQQFGRKQTVVTLACCHLENPDPRDVRNENLASLCSYHHALRDNWLRAKYAQERMKARREMLDFFFPDDDFI